MPSRAHFELFDHTRPHRLIEPEQRINVGIPARMPAAVVPAPPWWTTARQAGKTAAWFTAFTILTWSPCGMSVKSLAPPQIKARSPNCAQAAPIMATVSAAAAIGVLPKPK